MPARIVIDGRSLADQDPGLGRYVRDLVRALPRVAGDGEEICLLVDPGAPLLTPDELATAGVRRFETSLPTSGARQQLALPRLLRQLEATVFHAPSYLTACSAPCPLVVTLADALGARWPELLPSPRARWLYRLAHRLALRYATAVLTLSQDAKNDLVSLFGAAADRITVTPAALAPGIGPPAPAAVEEARARLGLPARYALHLGTNKPHKNLVRLIEAWAEVSRAAPAGDGEPGCWLVLAGRHDLRFPEARERARQLGTGNVRFLGEVAESDLPALYGGAQLVVLPSLSEGFGLPVLEAMACGTAVACSRTGALPRVAGAAAAYFDPLDPASIAATVAQLLKNKGYRETLAERGKAQAKAFTWERTARQTLNVYRRAAGGGA